jgi:hypothetical protein
VVDGTLLVMIVWINGAFGVGKTTAGLLTKRLDGAKVFDPEYVGHMLMPFVESPTGDFQDPLSLAAPWAPVIGGVSCPCACNRAGG